MTVIRWIVIFVLILLNPPNERSLSLLRRRSRLLQRSLKISWMFIARSAEVRHIEFCGSYLKIFTPRSKTHIDKEMTYTFHYASGSKFCPVGVLRRYLNLSGTDLQSTLPLFRPLVFQRSSFSYSLKGGKLSYTTCRDILRETLSGLDYNPNDYFLHSLSAGDITSAVHQSSNSISERLLKKHGRWKSDSAKDVYFEESLENRLQVTK